MPQVKVQTTVDTAFNYPAGTLLGQWRLRLAKGLIPHATQFIDDPLPAEVVFSSVAAGDYTLTIVRLSTGTVPVAVSPTVTKAITVLPDPPVVGGAPLDAVVTTA
jgi:hypothetical protein